MSYDPRIEIRIATPEDGPAILDHVNRIFNRPRPENIQTWKYAAYPWRRTIPAGVVALLDGVCVGFYGTVSWQLIVSGEVVDACQPCDVGVAEEYRGSGLYQDIYAVFRRSQPLFGRIAFGFPSAQALAIGQASMGYQIQSLTGLYLRQASLLEYGSDPVNVSTEIPADWFPYVTNKAAARGITTYRTREFMEWRFQNFESRSFVFVTVGEGESISGVCVANPTVTEVRIYDLFGDAASDIRSLLGTLTEVYPSLPLLYGCTDTDPYLANLAEWGFAKMQQGALVSSLLTDNGAERADVELREFERESQTWSASMTDTDM